MATEPVVIVGLGMISAVGLTAKETAASVRSGTMRFTLSDVIGRRLEALMVAEVPEDGMPPLAESLEALVGVTAREQRMLRLASAALGECVSVLPTNGRGQRLPLALALPETRTARPLDHTAFVSLLSTQAPAAFDPARTDPMHAGRAGGLVAVGQAVAMIQQGTAEFVVAGGVDTYCDLYILGALDAEARAKSDANPDGFVAGEGAAFLLLSTARAATSRGLAPLARLSAVAVGFEAGHLYSEEPYRGDGLATTFAQLTTLGAVEAPIQEVYSSMNGESHWAKEWGVGYTRNQTLFHPTHAIHHPAEYYGDTGAASGPLMVGLAAIGVRSGYRRSPALVYASSDRGDRAAVIVDAPTH